MDRDEFIARVRKDRRIYHRWQLGCIGIVVLNGLNAVSVAMKGDVVLLVVTFGVIGLLVWCFYLLQADIRRLDKYLRENESE